MAPSLQLTIIIIAVLLSSFWFPAATATSADFPDESVPDFIASSPTPTATSPYDIHDSFAPTSIFEPILSNLGFQELSMAVPSLSDDSAFTTWNGPTTIFAPTDASLKSCGSCSAVHLLREHIVPGLFSHEYLRKLAFGTKIETMDPGRCITVTSSTDANNDNYTKIYIGGVEITRPDLFNNGLIVVHGLQGYVAPLSPFSCNVERMTSLSFPVQTDNHNNNDDDDNNRQNAVVQQSLHHPIYIMRLMLRDAMLRLGNSGYSILALAMKMKSVELMSLHNMTVFALDDVSIFTGSHNYVNNVRFHIVPNMLLAISDLEKIKSGTLLPTLESGQSLMVTTTSGGFTPMRINYVRIKVPDVTRNLKIVVHSIYLPFPHLHPSAVTYEEDTTAGGSGSGSGVPHFELKNMDKDQVNGSGKCTATDQAAGSCDVVKPVVMRAEHQGL